MITLRQYYQENHPLLALHKQPIRTLGLYQPFASLMRHGKIETRWVKKDKKPPFPLGLYLFYSTQKRYEYGEIMQISGRKCFDWMDEVLKGDDTVKMCGYTMCIGELYMVGKMTNDIELECFVEYKESDTHHLIALRCRSVKHVFCAKWDHGKQGVGFVPDTEMDKITLIN